VQTGEAIERCGSTHNRDGACGMNAHAVLERENCRVTPLHARMRKQLTDALYLI
jgi:hypothetical protein